ncbi:MAG: hypothetical protein ACRCXZ_03585 [Patescibacteria group bacterium]
MPNMYLKIIYNLTLLTFAILQCILLFLPGIGDIAQDKVFENNSLLEPRILPADYAFAIWAPIFLGSIAFSIYSLAKTFQKQNLIEVIKPYALGAFISTTIYDLIARFESTKLLTAIAFVPILICLVSGLNSIRSVYSKSDFEKILTKGVFGLYAAWASLAIFVNFSSSILNLGYNGEPFGYQIFSFFVPVLALLFGLICYSLNKNKYYLGTLIWGFGGILFNSIQKNFIEVILVSILGLIVLTTIPFFEWKKIG